MFIPADNRATDPAIAFALITELRTGTLITQATEPGGAPDACHVPFLLDTDGADPETGEGAVLTGHVDRRNSQWQALVAHPPCRVAFLSPQTHVSPSWYTTKPRAPTWLFASVHAVGRATVTEDPAALRAMVERLSTELEPASSPWRVDSVADYTGSLLPYIVGFTIRIERLETMLRLRQGNSVEDRQRVLDAIEKGDASARAVAALMRRFAPVV